MNKFKVGDFVKMTKSCKCVLFFYDLCYSYIIDERVGSLSDMKGRVMEVSECKHEEKGKIVKLTQYRLRADQYFTKKQSLNDKIPDKGILREVLIEEKYLEIDSEVEVRRLKEHLEAHIESNHFSYSDFDEKLDIYFKNKKYFRREKRKKFLSNFLMITTALVILSFFAFCIIYGP